MLNTSYLTKVLTLKCLDKTLTTKITLTQFSLLKSQTAIEIAIILIYIHLNKIITINQTF